MKIQTKYKPELIVSKDSTRPQISEPWVDGDKMIATNGHMMVIVPVDLDSDDTAGIVPSECLKAARKQGGKSTETVVSANGVCKILGGQTFPRPDWKTPPYQQVLPKMRAGDKGTVTVGFNAKYLLELAKALGSERGEVMVTIDPSDPYAPYVVKTLADDDGTGILMPCKTKFMK